MNKAKELFNAIYKTACPFIKWILFGVIMGALGGTLGSVFHKSLEIVTEIRAENKWLIFLLPVAGLVITALYHIFRNKGQLSTDRVLEAAATNEKVPIIIAPLIFVSTLITHLFGGSAGREGAALQLGGSIGYNLGKLFKFNESDLKIIVMIGMSSCFAAMFGTPLTAAIFAIEVIRVGYVKHCGFMPCILASAVAYEISRMLGSEGVRFSVAIPEISTEVLVKVVILSVLCAVVSIIFCIAIKNISCVMHKYIRNAYLRSVVGALIIVGGTVLLNTTDYNGAGMDVLARAINGQAVPQAFLLKIIFTAVTIAAGFKGGEIVPTLFIGSTFGCVMGAVLGLDCSFAASVGFVALFCAVVNCPFASIALALEVFGGERILLYAVACGVSFMTSGNFSLYASQKIVFSKISSDEA